MVLVRDHGEDRAGYRHVVAQNDGCRECRPRDECRQISLCQEQPHQERERVELRLERGERRGRLGAAEGRDAGSPGGDRAAGAALAESGYRLVDLAAVSRIDARVQPKGPGLLSVQEPTCAVRAHVPQGSCECDPVPGLWGSWHG